MKLPSKRDILFIIITLAVGFLLGLVFAFIWRKPNPVPTQLVDPAIVKLQADIDTIKKQQLVDRRQRDSSDKVIMLIIDSVSADHIKTNNGVKQIHSFTPSSRQHWADSVKRANGL